MEEEKGFFGKFKDTVKSAASATARTFGAAKDKASDRIDLSKLKSRRSALELEIRGLYAQIGESVYQSADETIARGDFAAQIADIDERDVRLQEIAFEIIALQGGDDEKEEKEEKSEPEQEDQKNS